MEPARHIIAFASEPTDLVDRLKPVLVAQGSPPIYVNRENNALVFVSPTGEFMLRARVADALTEVCADWRAQVA
jgi:hypothetical protein